MRFGLWTILLIAGSLSAQENYSSWSHYKTVTVNTTADTINGAANVAATVSNFPLLVRLTSANTDVFTQAAANGADIRFTATNGIRLKHQRERWDAVNHLAEFWVLVPSVTGNALNTFRMYWGKTAVADSSNGAAVFDTTNGFRAVWHMNGSDAGNETDATVDALTATQTGGVTSIAGAVGAARSLDGATQYFTVLNSAAGVLNFHLTDNFTVSSWVYVNLVPAVANSGILIINKGDNQWTFEAQDNAKAPKYWVVEARGNNTFLNARSTGANGFPIVTADASIGGWHHLMGTYKGAPIMGAIAETLFFDGNPVATSAYVNTNNTGRNENFNVFIGALAAGTAPGTTFSRYWNGSLDEITVSKTVRSSAWVKLCHHTQKPGVNAVTLGASQVPVAIGMRHPAQRSQNRPLVLDVLGRQLWNEHAGTYLADLNLLRWE